MKHIKHWLATMAVLLCGITASAHDFEVDGIYYDIISSSDLTVAVTYKGSSPFLYSDEYMFAVTIPSSVTYNGETYSVTSIGDNAFYECSNLFGITIPESVKSIGKSAFESCSSLTNFSLPEGGVKSIGARAFWFCSGLTDITLPHSVMSIGDAAFLGCSSLKSIYFIGSTMKSIGSYVFEDCSSLVTINIPSSVTSIGEQAFYNCSSLASVTIPDGVTSIANDAFEGTAWYDNLPDGVNYAGKVLYKYKGTMPENTSIEVREGTESINPYAFQGCSGLIAITLPESVTSIGHDAFYNCSSLASITIPGGITSIENGTFLFCSSLASIILPVGVTSIGQSAFGHCESLSTIILPEGLPSIGLYAFAYCSGLTSITIPESVTSIGEYAFSNCKNLTSIAIPKNVKSIGSAAFYKCISLASITCEAVTPPTIDDFGAFQNVDNSIPVYVPKGSVDAYREGDGWNYFTNIQSVPYDVASGTCGDNLTWRLTDKYELIIEGTGEMYDYDVLEPAPWYEFRREHIRNVTIAEGVTSIGSEAFYNCRNLTSITIPENSKLTSIGDAAFVYCSGLTSIAMQESVTSIGRAAFQNCSNLTSITLPEGMTNIGPAAFYECNSLTSITLPTRVTCIGKETFYNCSNLSSITIPVNVTSIEEKAFHGCSSLTSITIPEGVTNIGESAFSGCSNLNFISIPEGVRSIENWAFFGCSSLSSIVLPEDVISIGEEAFGYCSNLTSITLSKDVVSIGNAAFRNCSDLTSITLPESVTSIGNGAFYDCSSLISITLPANVTSIENSVFYGCSSLTSIAVPEGLTNIGKRAFYNCSSLTSIIIPENVASIGTEAFYNCRNLTSITIPENSKLTGIGEYAFYRCDDLVSIIIPEGVTSIGGYAFSGCSSLTAITLPENVTSIGNHAFYDCSQLGEVYCYANSVPSAYDYTFSGVREDATLYVLASAIEDYRNTTPWSEFGTIETIKIAVSSIVLSHSSALLVEGESLILDVVVTPDDATDKTVSWTSSNPAVATVDAEGKVTAMLEGMAIITATTNDGSEVSASCEITVKEKPYDVIFMVDGEIHHICSSEDVIFPGAPEKQNHTFVEWLEGDDVVFEEVDLKNNADAMLYSNAYCTDERWGDQFVGWHVLFDGDDDTFFHSEYSDVDSEDGLDHYLRVDMGEGKCVDKFTFTYTVRGNIPNYGNYSPRNMIVEGSNEGNGEYSEIAALTDLPSEAGAVYESPTLGNGNKYRYIRFRVIETYQNQKVKGHPYFFMAEFGLKASKKARVYHAIYERYVDIVLNQYGSATSCSEYALDFSEVEGLKAYAATGYKTSTGIVTLTRVMTSQPGMGLFLKGEPGEYVVPTLESTDENSLNMLVGLLESTELNGVSDDGQYYNYRYTIHDGDESPMFYRVDDGYTHGAGKAYLQIPVAWMPEEARSVALRFDDEDGTTDIEDIESTANGQQPTAVYDLMGRKVANPQKGMVYIVNGKKVVW